MAFTQMGPLAASLAVGYLVGSIPVASLLTRLRGVEILNVGTRNPGAANVFREISRPLGAMVLALDALKGFAAVTMSSILGVEPEMVAAAGAAAIAGHWYPLFLRFKGGSGTRHGNRGRYRTRAACWTGRVGPGPGDRQGHP